MSIKDEIEKRVESVSGMRALNKELWKKFLNEWDKVEVAGMPFKANHEIYALSHEGWRNSMSIRYLYSYGGYLELSHNACREFGYEPNSRSGWSYRVVMSEEAIKILNEKMLQWAARALVSEYEGE